MDHNAKQKGVSTPRADGGSGDDHPGHGIQESNDTTRNTYWVRTKDIATSTQGDSEPLVILEVDERDALKAEQGLARAGWERVTRTAPPGAGPRAREPALGVSQVSHGTEAPTGSTRERTPIRHPLFIPEDGELEALEAQRMLALEGWEIEIRAASTDTAQSLNIPFSKVNTVMNNDKILIDSLPEQLDEIYMITEDREDTRFTNATFTGTLGEPLSNLSVTTADRLDDRDMDCTDVDTLAEQLNDLSMSAEARLEKACKDAHTRYLAKLDLKAETKNNIPLKLRGFCERFEARIREGIVQLNSSHFEQIAIECGSHVADWLAYYQDAWVKYHDEVNDADDHFWRS
ncbi:hypothetical protein FA15DRAFT_695122 [Coprinopsis marcescibilis]|uniref:Uncharacterized protein n=1 Tax=Coprinopsis marcescibilis TaxID=230819 RepID=A0A5C3KSE0_COPMA|nr:hypothetical protein FA15DRAFT_695122 [Coprinopsis marcescibilis]